MLCLYCCTIQNTKQIANTKRVQGTTIKFVVSINGPLLICVIRAKMFCPQRWLLSVYPHQTYDKDEQTSSQSPPHYHLMTLQ